MCIIGITVAFTPTQRDQGPFLHPAEPVAVLEARVGISKLVIVKSSRDSGL